MIVHSYVGLPEGKQERRRGIHREFPGDSWSFYSFEFISLSRWCPRFLNELVEVTEMLGLLQNIDDTNLCVQSHGCMAAKNGAVSQLDSRAPTWPCSLTPLVLLSFHLGHWFYRDRCLWYLLLSNPGYRLVAAIMKGKGKGKAPAVGLPTYLWCHEVFEP